MHDAASYAKAMGLTDEEAARRLDLQAEAGALSGLLETEGAAWFGGLWIEHDPSIKVVVYATKEAPSLLTEATAGSDLVAITTVQVVDRTLASLLTDLEKVGPDLAERGYIVDIDVRNNAIRVEGPSESEARGLVDDEGIASAIEFIRSDRKVSTAALAYAGLRLDEAGVFRCTEGFSVLQGSTRRLTTAAHCPNSLQRNGVNVPFVAANSGGSHDEQMHGAGTLTITNRALDNSLDAASHGYRSITSRTTRANQALNSFYCRYGVGTTPAYNCGFLVSKTTLGAMGSAAATSMRLHNAGVDLASPGDSGGPVYNGASAVGMIHACISTDLQCDNPTLKDDLVYIAMDFVESGLSVSILTTP